MFVDVSGSVVVGAWVGAWVPCVRVVLEGVWAGGWLGGAEWSCFHSLIEPHAMTVVSGLAA